LVCSGKANGDGTVIERRREVSNDETIVGIALQEAVSYTINDIRMEHENGVVEHIAGKLGVPLVDVTTGKGVVRAYITKANHDARRADLQEAFTNEYGDRFALRGEREENRLSIVTLVGEALARNTAILAKITNKAVNIGHENGIEVFDFWPSPNHNAVYLTVPTNDVNSYAVAAYDDFFPASEEQSVRT
jgi:aspartokinase